MKKIITFCFCLFLCGCNIRSTSLTPDYASGLHKFDQIDVKNTTKSGKECEISIPLLLIYKAPLGKEEVSVMKIAKKYNINTITYVENNWEFVLPFFINRCYTVYGY